MAAVASMTLGSATRVRAEPHPPEHSVTVLSSTGMSFALGDRRAANLAPPSVELRLARAMGWPRRVSFDVNLVGYAYPETVVAAGVGVRVHPLSNLPVGDIWYVRAATHALLARGSDLALSAESGLALEHARLLGWLGVGVDRFLLHPRAVVQVKVGFGVAF